MKVIDKSKGGDIEAQYDELQIFSLLNSEKSIRASTVVQMVEAIEVTVGKHESVIQNLASI